MAVKKYWVTKSHQNWCTTHTLLSIAALRCTTNKMCYYHTTDPVTKPQTHLPPNLLPALTPILVEDEALSVGGSRLAFPSCGCWWCCWMCSPLISCTPGWPLPHQSNTPSEQCQTVGQLLSSCRRLLWRTPVAPPPSWLCCGRGCCLWEEGGMDGELNCWQMFQIP